MNTLPKTYSELFPKVDPVVPGLCALKVALDRDYEQGKHDLVFDIVPDPSGGDPALWNSSCLIEVSYLGVNSYKTEIADTGFIGSLNDTRIIIQARSNSVHK